MLILENKDIPSSRPIENLFKKSYANILVAQELKNLLKSLKSVVSLGNATQTNKLYSLFLKKLKNLVLRAPIEAELDYSRVLNILSLSGLGTAATFANTIKSESDLLKAKGFDLSKIKEGRSSKYRELGKEYVESGYIEPGQEIDLSFSENDIDDNINRYVVVRNQWGQESPYIYNIGRRKMSVKLGNIIRAVYAFQTTSNYFQAYPILLSHWLKLDDYHKITGYKG